MIDRTNFRDLFVDRGGLKIYARQDGPNDPNAPTIVFSNSLGTTLHLWDLILPVLTEGIRIVRYDTRGHGKSDIGDGKYTMGQLVSDAAAVCDAFQVRNAMFVGLSVGGMVAQGLAVKRPDLVRAMVLSNTAAKIGNPPLWHNRIDTVLDKGMLPLVNGILDRWFSKDFRNTASVEPWQDMIATCEPAGYAGVCHAISGTDFYTPTSGIRIPTLGVAGSEDGSTPVDLVRETIDLIPGSQFEIMRRCGHLPCVEKPDAFAGLLNNFIIGTGHNKSQTT